MFVIKGGEMTDVDKPKFFCSDEDARCLNGRKEHPLWYEYEFLMCALEGLAGLFGVH